jgi:hypothetical protein
MNQYKNNSIEMYRWYRRITSIPLIIFILLFVVMMPTVSALTVIQSTDFPGVFFADNSTNIIASNIK